MNVGRQTTVNKIQGKIGKGKVLSSYKSQIDLSKQKLQDLIPGIDVKKQKKASEMEDVTKQSRPSAPYNPLKGQPLKSLGHNPVKEISS